MEMIHTNGQAPAASKAYDIYDTFPSSRGEALVVAGLLQRTHFLHEAARGGLDAGWFLQPRHSLLAGVICQVYARDGRADLAAVLADLEEAGHLAIAGGARYLVDLASAYVNDYAFFDELTRMARGAYLRRFDRALWSLHADVFDPEAAVTLAERVARMEAGLGEIMKLSPPGGAMHAAAALADLALTPSQFTPTGLYSLDEAICGYMPGRVTMLAGRPSHGKTAIGVELALRMARRHAPKRTGQVLYFSAEMGAQAVAHRLVANLARVNSRDLMDGRLVGNVSVADAARLLRTLPLSVDDTAAPTSAYMMGRALAAHADLPVRLVLFDYLQYTGEREREGRRQTLDAALRGCHELAKRLACPVVVLAQLNREVDKRAGGGEPQLSDMKETGATEEVAALVLMVQHPWTQWKQTAGALDDEPLPGDFNIFVRKNTHGPLGAARLVFERETGRFTDPNEPTF